MIFLTSSYRETYIYYVKIKRSHGFLSWEWRHIPSTCVMNFALSTPCLSQYDGLFRDSRLEHLNNILKTSEVRKQLCRNTVLTDSWQFSEQCVFRKLFLLIAPNFIKWLKHAFVLVWDAGAVQWRLEAFNVVCLIFEVTSYVTFCSVYTINLRVLKRE